MATATDLKLDTQDEVLQALSAGQIDTVTAGKRLAELNRPSPGSISIKVRPLGVKFKDKKGEEHIGKGNILVYGLQRWPVSFYAGQWQTLLGEETRGKILSAIDENKDVLDWKK